MALLQVLPVLKIAETKFHTIDKKINSVSRTLNDKVEDWWRF